MNDAFAENNFPSTISGKPFAALSKTHPERDRLYRKIIALQSAGFCWSTQLFCCKEKYFKNHCFLLALG